MFLARIHTSLLFRFSWQEFHHMTMLSHKVADNHLFFNNSVTTEDGKAGFWWTTSSLYQWVVVINNKWLSWDENTSFLCPQGTWWGRYQRPESYIKKLLELRRVGISQSSLRMSTLGNSLPFFESQFPYLWNRDYNGPYPWVAAVKALTKVCDTYEALTWWNGGGRIRTWAHERKKFQGRWQCVKWPSGMNG